jgi:hypothetical protein
VSVQSLVQRRVEGSELGKCVDMHHEGRSSVPESLAWHDDEVAATVSRSVSTTSARPPGGGGAGAAVADGVTKSSSMQVPSRSLRPAVDAVVPLGPLVTSGTVPRLQRAEALRSTEDEAMSAKLAAEQIARLDVEAQAAHWRRELQEAAKRAEEVAVAEAPAITAPGGAAAVVSVCYRCCR